MKIKASFLSTIFKDLRQPEGPKFSQSKHYWILDKSKVEFTNNSKLGSTHH